MPRPEARSGPPWRHQRATVCQQAEARDGPAAVCGAAAVGEALVGKRVDGGLARRGHEEAHHVVSGEQHAEGALDACMRGMAQCVVWRTAWCTTARCAARCVAQSCTERFVAPHGALEDEPSEACPRDLRVRGRDIARGVQGRGVGWVGGGGWGEGGIAGQRRTKTRTRRSVLPSAAAEPPPAAPPAAPRLPADQWSKGRKRASAPRMGSKLWCRSTAPSSLHSLRSWSRTPCTSAWADSAASPPDGGATEELVHASSEGASNKSISSSICDQKAPFALAAASCVLKRSAISGSRE